MALLPLRPGEGEAGAVSLYDEPLVMLIAADHPLAGRGQVTTEALAAETMFARRSCEFLDAPSRLFTQQRLRPRLALPTDNAEGLTAQCPEGVGVTLGKRPR